MSTVVELERFNREVGKSQRGTRAGAQRKDQLDFAAGAAGFTGDFEEGTTFVGEGVDLLVARVEGRGFVDWRRRYWRRLWIGRGGLRNRKRRGGGGGGGE